jgi:transcriptional regulator GlxA family with amidase domain
VTGLPLFARFLPVHRVAVLVFDKVAVFEMAVPCEVWGLDRRDLGVPRAEVRVCSADPRPLHTDMGFTIDTDHGLETLRWADTVVVVGAPKPLGTRPVAPDVVAALRRAHRTGARIASVCSGAFVVAAAGLLDGRRATCHWLQAAHFRRAFPEVELDPNVLYVGDGQVFTSAGTAAGIDLCLHLVRLDWGAEVANAVARGMIVPPHRDGGQAQYVLAPVPEVAADPLGPAMEWVLTHPEREISVAELAHRARMAPRTFARHFRAATGTTPLQWVLSQRVALAQRLLETTDLPVEHVAQQSGLGSGANLRQHFARVTGTTPQAYRSTFRRAG